LSAAQRCSACSLSEAITCKILMHRRAGSPQAAGETLVSQSSAMPQLDGRVRSAMLHPSAPEIDYSMLSSLSENRSLAFAPPSPTPVDPVPTNRLRAIQRSAADNDRLSAEQPEPHLQQLIKHSMDDELLLLDQQRTDHTQTQAALIKERQKQISTYSITQAQLQLLGFPRIVGYG